ncbi:Uncharacterized protein FKW44_000076 [Caligus rogercresseyi]|uniref:Uncharacterized protein n=1 Tax=Caligus rogercresseyi TaxID=217165 RepID=A0A7T8KGS5_CALRO|nr:Uncharacterized protein FKW44_000076 [Caligus rogercresseyi]
MEQARRTTICELRRAGHSAAAIFKMTQYNRKTVYNVVKAFDEEGKTTRKDHSPRSDKIRTPSDEKIFTVDESVSRRNVRWICQDPKEVKPTMSSKKPAAVMTLAVISSEGDVMVPHFFQANETVIKPCIWTS